MSEKNKKDNLDDFEIDSNSFEEFEFEESNKKKEIEDDFDFDLDDEKTKSKEIEISEDFDFEIEDKKIETTNSKEVEVDDDFDFEIEEEKPAVANSKEVEIDDDFDFEIEEEKPAVANSKEVEIDDDFDFEIEEEKPAVAKSKEVEIDDDFDFEIEEEKPAVAKSKEVEIDDDFDFEIEEEKPTVAKSKEVEVDDDFDFEIEEEKPTVAKSKEVEVDDDFDFEIEEEKPAVAKSKEDKKEFDFEEIEEDFFEPPKVETKKPKLKENNEKPLNIDELFNDNKSEKDEGFNIDSFIKNDNSNEEFIPKAKQKTVAKVNIDIQEESKEFEIDSDKKEVEKSLEHTEKKEKTFSLTKLMFSLIGVTMITAVSYVGYINKDNLSNIVSNKSIIESEEFLNKTREIANEVAISKTNEYQVKLEEALSKISKLNEEQANLIKENLELKDQIKNIKDTQDNTNTANIEMQIASFSEKINLMESQQQENRELLKSAVNATLSLIRENQKMDKNLEDKVYQKVYTEFEKIFNSQRFRLNDLSIIESKMNENVQIINQIKQELRQYRSENENLKTKIKLLENNDKATTSIVIDKKAKVESKKPVVTPKEEQPKEVKEVAKSLNQNNFKIQGIIDSDIAYIVVKGFNNSKAKAYTIGDNVPNCGKITKITENTVVCTGGTLKYNN